MKYYSYRTECMFDSEWRLMGPRRLRACASTTLCCKSTAVRFMLPRYQYDHVT